jgi:putative DNA primase/helicase
MSIYKDEDQPAGKPKGTLISLDDIVEARWHLAQRGKLNDVELLCAADIVPQPIEWLWPGWLAVGKLAILAGLPGTGKTTLALALAATITRAGHWPDQSPCAKGGRVLVWSGEDDPGDTLVPRLQAAGADLDRVQFLNAVWEQRGKRAFDPADDMPKMATAIERHGDVRLLIIDPIVSAVKGDSHKAAEVRRSLQPIADFAMRQRCAVLGITHFSKGSGGSNPLDRVIGSQAFGALARIVLVAGKSEQGEGRVLARAKSNIGPDDGGVGYTLEDVVLPSGITTSRVLWGEMLAGSARELLGEVERVEEGGSAVDGAGLWLQAFLAEGPQKSADIQAAGQAQGYSWRIVQRAKKTLGIGDYRQGFGRDSAVWWSRRPQ